MAISETANLLETATLTLSLRMVTPAFLGDADQRGEWRTPPFKTLVRQWWRVRVSDTTWLIIRPK